MRRSLRPFGLLALLAVAACAGGPPPVALPISQLCEQPSGTIVQAEGYLGLPLSSLRCKEGQCQINFFDANGEVSVEYVASKTPSPGRLTLPPAPYTLDDLHVTLSDGTSVDRTTRVRISGPIRVAPKICYLEAYSTELP